MSESTLLELPLLEASQAQKHVTHNEALLRLDAVVHLTVKSRTLAAPPSSPAAGDRYLLESGSTATGAWAGQDGRIAIFQSGAWDFAVARTGWRLWIVAEDRLVVFDGTAWRDAVDTTTLQNVNLLGVNSTADASNRLAVASAGVLFNHTGSDQQVKINKHAAADTGSLLYQTNFSGRAEMGLAGDDNFHVKVSGNGTAWTEAIVIDRTTGVVSLPATPATGVSDGDKGDINVSSAGASWAVKTGAVTTAKLGGDVTTAGKALLTAATADAQATLLGAYVFANSRTSLSNLATAHGTAYLTEAGREGAFQYLSAGQILARYGVAASTLVAADTQKGFAVATSGDPTGAVGAWLRVQPPGQFDARHFGAVADGTTDQSTVLQGAINVIAVLSGGRLHVPPAALPYALAATLTVNASNVRLAGFGADSRHIDTQFGNLAASVLKWTGASGGTMMLFESPSGASNYKQSGGGASGLMLDANSLAGVGLQINSWSRGTFDWLGFKEFSTAAIRVDVVAALWDARDANKNTISNIAIWNSAQPGDGLVMQATTPGANPSGNLLYKITVQHKNGHGINLYNCDNNRFIRVGVSRTSGGSGTSLVLNGSNTAAGYVPRSNVFDEFGCDTAPVFKGTSSYTYPAGENYIYNMDRTNNAPAPTYESGTTGEYGYDDGVRYFARNVRGVFGKTKAQLDVGRTRLDSTNYSLGIVNDANAHIELANSALTGLWGFHLDNASHDLTINSSLGGGKLLFRGSVGWYVSGANHMLVATDNTYDIGAAGANRPRNIYAGGTITGANLSGTNTGDQTITLTGDATGSGTASVAVSIGTNKVTNAHLAQVTTASFKGRATAGTGDVEDLSAAQATALLNGFTTTLKGVVNAPGAVAGKFLRDDNSWATPAAGGVSDGDKGDITVSGSGTVWTIDANTIDNARAAPMAAATIKGNSGGSAANPSDLTATQVTAMLNAFSTASKGLVPAPGTSSGRYLKDDGSWAAAAGTGDVAGPASAADKALARYSGTTGKLIQNSAVLLNDDGSIRLPSVATPAASAADTLNVLSLDVAGREMLAMRGQAGIATVMQPLMARNKVGLWSPPGNSTTMPAVSGIAAPVALGTATARNVAATNLFTRTRRLGYVSAATAGSLAGHYATVAQFTIGDGAGLGGFLAVFRFGVSDAAAVSGARMFVGLRNSVAAPTNVEPNTLTNSIGVAQLSSSNNLQIVYGGSAAQTAIDLGASFPANSLSADAYELALYAPSNSQAVNYRVERLNTGDVANGVLSGTVGTAIPAATTFLGQCYWRCNNAAALAVGIDVTSFYVETEN